MPCYHPIPAQLEHDYRPGQPPKRRMKLHPKGEPTHWLPCGTCLGCREIQQQQLSLRVIHEAKSHGNNQFLTLTYDDDKLPDGLQKADLQKFWKRLRKNTNQQFKYLACGEYGERTHRPHYHAAVLGLAIDDLKKWDSENSRSQAIENIWKNGIVTVSELTQDRIRYVAGYVLKKAGYRKQIYCDEDGVELENPYRDMSKALGKKWIERYQTDLRNGYLQHEGAKFTIPRYYKDYIKSKNPDLDRHIEQQKSNNWKELTAENRTQLHTAEKIRQKEIKEQKSREKV